MRPRGFGPSIGEHTEDVLGSVGYTAEDIDSLRASGAVG